MADRATTGVAVFVTICVAGATILAGIGGSVSGENRGWYVAAAWVFGAGVFAAFMYFVYWPFMQWLIRWRQRMLYGTTCVDTRSVTIEVIEATYGGKDVTEAVRSKIEDGRLDFTVSNEELGGDPAPGEAKTLHITRRLDGKQARESFKEGARVTIPSPGR